MENDLIKIYLKFGFETQIEKLREEYIEFENAFHDYRMSLYLAEETKEQFIDVIDELGDMVNVAYGIAIAKYGMSYDEIEATKIDKRERTIYIVNEMIRTGKTYDEIRYKNENKR